MYRFRATWHARLRRNVLFLTLLGVACAAGGAGTPGNVFAWGDNTYGQTTIPQGISEVVRVAAGAGHTLALTTQGRVIAWGSNAYGQTNVPTHATNVVAIAATEQSSIALRNDGTVVVWGYKYPGGVELPADLANVSAIAGGAHHGLALLSNGTVRAWGSWEWRQTDVPAGLDRVDSIAAGGHLSAVLRDGRCIYWGNFLPSAQTSPEPTGYFALLRKLCVTEQYVLAVRQDGWLMHFQSSYAFSRGYVSYDIIEADAGVDHALFLAGNGGIATIGDNSRGQCNVPPALIGARAVAAGNWHSVVVATAPLIERQPKSHILIAGDAVLFDVGAKSNVEISYQWRSRGTNIPGAVSSNLSLGPASPAAAGDYSVRVSDRYGSVLSSTAQLTVIARMADQTVSAGWDCSFRADVAGTAPLTFEWHHNGSAIPSATNQELRLVNVQSNNAGVYTVLVRGANGGSNRVSASLNVAPSGPTIVQRPEEQVAATGTNILFVVRAIGSEPLFFQWSFEGTNISGATNTTLVVEDIQPDQGGAYRVEVTNSEGQAGATAFVWLQNTAPWFTREPVDHRVPEGMVFPLTLTAEVAGARPWYFQWQRDGTNIPGATQAALTLQPVLRTDEGSYRLMASSPFGSVTSRTVRLTVPVRSTESGTEVGWGQSVCVQGMTNVSAMGGGYDLSLVVGEDRTVYTWACTQAGAAPPGLSNVVALAGGLQHTIALTREGRVVCWGWEYGCTGLPPDLTNAVAIAAGYTCSLALKADGTVVTWGNCFGGGELPGSLSNVVSIAAGEGHYLALRSDGTVAAWGHNHVGQTEVPPGLSNVVAIVAGGHQSLAIVEGGTLVGWGSPGVPEGLTNVAAATAGWQYTLVLKQDGTITGWGWNNWGQLNYPSWLRGVTAIHASYSTAYALTRYPVIISQSRYVHVGGGSNALMEVRAAAEGRISYSWEQDGVAVPGATNNVLAISNVQASHGGTYKLRISNEEGSILSEPISFIVLPTIVVQPAVQVANLGGSATISLSATGTEPLLYVWYKDGAFAAYTSEPSLVLTDLKPSDAGNYLVSVEGPLGSYHRALSQAASLVLIPPISLSRSGQTMRLSWPVWSNELQLEFAPDLIQQSWRRISLAPGTNSWIMPTTGPHGFYRLMPALATDPVTTTPPPAEPPGGKRNR